MNDTNNILIYDDDRDIIAALRIYLAPEGYGIFEAHNGREAVEAVENGDIQLVLMDIMMPGLDGIAATSKLREKHNIPIILITAKSEDADKALGLDVGADDYITKPFSPLEVQARVRSQLRRYTRLGGMAEKPGRLQLGGVELDDAGKTASVDGEPVPLTPTEFRILRLLMLSPGRVYSSAEIYESVSGQTPIGSEGAVAVHIRHLREKIEISPAEPRYIKVVWGHGYKFDGGCK